MNATNKNAFTVLEIIIAIFILNLAVFGTFILIQQTLIGASLNQLQLIAYYLGQEGTEIVRNIRDINWLQREEWTTGLAVGLGWQEADYQSTALATSQSRNLKIDSSGFYNYSSGSDTVFKRRIRVIPVSDYLQIEIIVEWTDRGKDYSVEVIDYLYNWYAS
jgi:hypothetical protein